MANVGNWIVENCNTTGTGALSLGGSPIGFARFIDAMPSGEVWYVIEDGGNKEAGVGVFNGANLITRTDIRATFINGTYNTTNPTPINLTGTSQVACTFNASAFDEIFAHLANTDNPHNVIAVQVAYDSSTDPVTDEDTVQEAMLDHASSIEQRVASMSGIISGGVLSGSDSTFSVSAGSGEILDSYTDPSNTEIVEVTWLDNNNIVLDLGGRTLGSNVILMTSAGNVLQIASPITAVQYRENIVLGIIFFNNSSIVEVTSAPSVIKQTATDLYDLLRQDISLMGNSIQPVTNLLEIWIAEGNIFYPGVNWVNDRTNPNLLDTVQQGDDTTPVPIYLMTQDGSVTGPVTTIPDQYNPTGNTLSNMGGDDATIHRLFVLGVQDGTRIFILLYGQNEYNNASTAKGNIGTDDNSTVIPMGLLTSAFFLGHIGVKNNANDFNDLEDAWIVSKSESSSNAGGGASSDHTALANRDVVNQHPIEAVGTSGGEQLRDSLDAKTQWEAEWIQQEYLTNQMVRDGDWTMIANKSTTDRAGPQPASETTSLFSGTLLDESVITTVLNFGIRHTPDTEGYIDAYRILTYAGVTYSVSMTDGATSTVIEVFLADSSGWQSRHMPAVLLSSGVEIDVVATITEVGPVSIPYGREDDYYLTSTVAKGLFSTNAAVVVDDNAYGIDLVIQPATISPDWDLVARSGGSSTGGGGTGQAIQSRTLFTNVQGQTTFPVVHEQGQEQIFFNGALLTTENYTDTATDITLNFPVPSAVDEVEAAVYSPVDVSSPENFRETIDVYSKAETDNGRKNYLINGDMSVWQRGDGPFTATSVFTADRWYKQAALDTVTRAVTLNGSRMEWESTDTSSRVWQRVEGAVLRGKTVTFSVTLQSPSGLTSLYMLNSGGGAGSGFLPLVTTPNVSERVSVTLNIPQDGDGEYTEFRIYSGAIETIFVEDVQLESGSVATPFEYVSAGDNLAACQRYYWQGLPLAQINYSAYVSGAYWTAPFALPVTMRTTPTLTNMLVGSASSNIDLTLGNDGMAAQQPTNNGFKMMSRSSAASVNCFSDYTGYITADAEL